MNFRIGDIITFTYPLPPRTRAHDQFPQVLVLHPNWKGLMHGLNLNYLVDDEINAIRMLIDPMFEEKYAEALNRKNPRIMQELDRIVLKMGNSNITSPHDFYLRVIRPFIIVRGWDPYRKYRPDKMTNVRLVQKREVIMGQSRASMVFNQRNLRDRNSTENKIIQNVAQQSAQNTMNAQQRRFVARLQGSARKLFDDYVKKFQHMSGGVNTPNFPHPGR